MSDKHELHMLSEKLNEMTSHTLLNLTHTLLAYMSLNFASNHRKRYTAYLYKHLTKIQNIHKN